MVKKSSSNGSRNKSLNSFSIGRVHGWLRGKVWYLRYTENGRRKQPRVGPDLEQARQLAAEINSQLENATRTTLGFEPISIVDLRKKWLDRHEHIRRSSLATIRRYRSATEHLMTFIRRECPVRRVSEFRPTHAEQFVQYLRSLRTAPNGHPNSRKKPLRDAGVKYILETCSNMFYYALKNRHLPPYTENPFQVIEVGRIPIEDAQPITIFDEEQEEKFLNACDNWQFPLYLTMFMTGMRPGEVCHLLLPDDLDLIDRWIHIRNKPRLGWQVKTRTERSIPIALELVRVLEKYIGERRWGPVFQQRRCFNGFRPLLADKNMRQLEAEYQKRLDFSEDQSRKAAAAIAHGIWLDLCSITNDLISREYLKITRKMEFSEKTSPKSIRHTFATTLQDANIDPLIRNELMGHSPSDGRQRGGLGMTARYTHTRPETKRRQLEQALAQRPGVRLAKIWCDR